MTQRLFGQEIIPHVHIPPLVEIAFNTMDRNEKIISDFSKIIIEIEREVLTKIREQRIRGLLRAMKNLSEINLTLQYYIKKRGY